MKPEISIIIPAFEEEARLGDSIEKILTYVEKEKLSAELIIVDDGSADRTAEIGESAAAGFPALQTKVIRYEPNRGKGFAVKTGLLSAAGDIAVFSDADLSTPIDEIAEVGSPD
jgi:dolichyl-phosphate beta-glucosyltransferase